MATTADIRAQLSNKDYPEARSAEARIVCLLLYMARQTRPDILASVTRKESRKGALGDWKEGTSLPEGEQRSGTVLSKDAGDVNFMNPQVLTGLKVWMIEGQLLDTAFICRRQG